MASSARHASLASFTYIHINIITNSLFSHKTVLDYCRFCVSFQESNTFQRFTNSYHFLPSTPLHAVSNHPTICQGCVRYIHLFRYMKHSQIYAKPSLSKTCSGYYIYPGNIPFYWALFFSTADMDIRSFHILI